MFSLSSLRLHGLCDGTLGAFGNVHHRPVTSGGEERLVEQGAGEGEPVEGRAEKVDPNVFHHFKRFLGPLGGLTAGGNEGIGAREFVFGFAASRLTPTALLAGAICSRPRVYR